MKVNFFFKVSTKKKIIIIRGENYFNEMSKKIFSTQSDTFKKNEN